MVIGLCDRMAAEWLDEFKRACDWLHLEWRLVPIGRDDWMDRVADLDAFVWRVTMGDASCMAEARTKIPLLEAMGIPCFPNGRMLWLYDDKIRETLFLRQHHYPTPRTWIFFEEAAAREFLAQAAYPLVTKSHCGASASGVALLHSQEDACLLLDGTFKPMSIWDKVMEKFYFVPRLQKGDLLLQLRYRYRKAWPRYAYFQEFIQTDCDWRITTLGHNLVSVFVRRNRPHDFRASGSGLWQRVEARDLPIEACDLALRISRDQRFTSMTYDFMASGGRWLIGEISYAFVLNDIYATTLFRLEQGGYCEAEPIPIGVMHVRALLDAVVNHPPGEESSDSAPRSGTAPHGG